MRPKIKRPAMMEVVTWKRDNLWLTAGGRVVKPGPGEVASVLAGDIIILTDDELQRGVNLADFEERFKNVKSEWMARHAKGKYIYGDDMAIVRSAFVRFSEDVGDGWLIQRYHDDTWGWASPITEGPFESFDRATGFSSRKEAYDSMIKARLMRRK